MSKMSRSTKGVTKETVQAATKATTKVKRLVKRRRRRVYDPIKERARKATPEYRAKAAAWMRERRALNPTPNSLTPPPRIYVGMDVHKDTIMMAVLPDDKPSPTIVQRIVNEERKLKAFLDRVAESGATLFCCYEISYSGYAMYHWVTGWGYHCEAIAPSLIPTKPGDRRKHDARDATQLARLYRAGELTTVWVPTTEDERARDMLRCRTTLQRTLIRTKHVILNFLARRNCVYRAEQTHWKAHHINWIKRLIREETITSHDAFVLTEYMALLDYIQQRRLELDRQIALLAESDRYRERVALLRCFKGLDTHAAMVLITEIGDWSRFISADKFACYLEFPR